MKKERLKNQATVFKVITGFALGWALICSASDSQPLALPLGQHPQEIKIHGPASNLAFFVNGKNIFEPVQLDATLSDQQKADLIFQFARDQFLAWDAKLTMPLGALYYGYGFGLCGEQARVMASILYENGIPARMVSLKHHVMIEGEIDGKWQLYDPQHHLNYSQFFGRTLQFKSILGDDFAMPDGIDPVGYLWSHMEEIFRTGTPTYADVKWTLPPPKISMGDHQSLTIRPRPTNTFYPLPVIYPRPQYQTNMIPYYLLEIEHHFQGEEIARFEKGLPILAAEFSDGVAKEIWIDGEAIQMDPTNPGDPLIGAPKTIEIRMSQGSSCKVIYALSGWIGDRLFKNQPDATMSIQPQLDPTQISIRTHSSLPQLWIDSVTLAIPPKPRKHYQVKVTLGWSNFEGVHSLAYQLILDELISDIPLELLSSLPLKKFVWQPEKHGSNGKQTMRFSWEPSFNKSSKVPDSYRILCAQVSGPHVRAGHNALKKSFTLPQPSKHH